MTDRQALSSLVHDVVAAQPVTDLHTHVFSPAFGASHYTPEGVQGGNASGGGSGAGLLLWGIDELVTYHYLVAEVFRVVPPRELSYDDFWAMPKPAQADHIWQHLFVENTPLSEACRGVVTTLSRLGLDPTETSLAGYRQWFSEQDPSGYIDQVMQLANVDQITMTNEVFSDQERQLWLDTPGLGEDERFAAVLRIDAMLVDWPATAAKLSDWGYDVSVALDEPSVAEARRFLTNWIDRMGAVYVATSLPPDFRYPAEDGAYQDTQRVIDEVLLPVLAERDLPWAMMIGSKRQVNPSLKDAGDMVGKSDVQAVVRLCAQHPENRFMCTMLSRENQHELCIAARKFGNLFLFGCWWFLNNPSLIDEMTRMRLELLGPTFAPQHSDARILDQLIYKWDHSRRIIADVLTDKYADLQAAGYPVQREHVERDAALLLRNNYRKFIQPAG
jgi:hypothetical protein